MSFLNHPKEPPYPVITECNSLEVRGKKCTNMNSRLFEIKSIKDKNGIVMSWEIQCPMCGTVWYQEVGINKAPPRKHRKNSKNRLF